MCSEEDPSSSFTVCCKIGHDVLAGEVLAADLLHHSGRRVSLCRLLLDRPAVVRPVSDSV